MNKLLYCLVISCIALTACIEDEATLGVDAGVEKSEEIASEPAEKTRQAAINSCRLTCDKKFQAGCPDMDTYTERQVCYDTCSNTQTYPTACESQYIALNVCRTTPVPAYTCNSSGQPVPTASCLLQQLSLGYCKQQNP